MVLGLLNGEQGVPMGGAPHVYLRRVGNGLVYCMIGDRGNVEHYIFFDLKMADFKLCQNTVY